MIFFRRFIALIIISKMAIAEITSVNIVAGGDLLLHYPLQLKAKDDGFESIWRDVTPYLKSADIAYANLEGPIASGIDKIGNQLPLPNVWDFDLYSDFPLFNYHPSLAKALKQSGFTILSTANNHALDRHAIGIDKTLEILKIQGITPVGSRPQNSATSFVTMVEKNGIKTAWIACTSLLNGMQDTHQQVLMCEPERIIHLIQETKRQADAIVICPHWGEEYRKTPTASQTQFAHRMLEAGATAIIGSHPHVLQPIVPYKTRDGRDTLIAYSLGNFVSFQGIADDQATRTTVLLFLSLTKDEQGTVLSGFHYLPLHMQNRDGTRKIKLAILPQNKNTPMHRILSQNIAPQYDLRQKPK